jgi:hypothetical protein
MGLRFAATARNINVKAHTVHKEPDFTLHDPDSKAPLMEAFGIQIPDIAGDDLELYTMTEDTQTIVDTELGLSGVEPVGILQ